MAELRQHMGIGVHRDADLGVPEDLHDRARWDARGEQEGRASMP
jgi:hypothetical protein